MRAGYPARMVRFAPLSAVAFGVFVLCAPSSCASTEDAADVSVQPAAADASDEIVLDAAIDVVAEAVDAVADAVEDVAADGDAAAE